MVEQRNTGGYEAHVNREKKMGKDGRGWALNKVKRTMRKS